MLKLTISRNELSYHKNMYIYSFIYHGKPQNHGTDLHLNWHNRSSDELCRTSIDYVQKTYCMVPIYILNNTIMYEYDVKQCIIILLNPIHLELRRGRVVSLGPHIRSGWSCCFHRWGLRFRFK